MVEIDPRQADALQRFSDYVAWSPKGHILQTVAWGELKRRTGWVPLRFLLEDVRTGEPRGALSALLRRLPLPGRSLYLAYAPRGPVIDYGDEAAMAALFRSASDALRRRGAIALKIDPDIPSARQDVVDRLGRCGFRRMGRGLGFEGVQPRFVFRLPLDGPPDVIRASFHPKTRYNIRLAERRGVEVREAASPDDMAVFYRILLETARRDRFLVRAESYYRDMWELLIEPGLARLFLADHEGETLAGTIAFILGDKAWYVYGASSNTRRDVMPNYLLQWTMIQWALKNGCTLYDFRGVSGNLDPADPLYGLYRFKKGFAAELTEFIGEFDLVLRPALYRLYSVGEPAYRRFRARLRPASRQGASPEDLG
jgi:lipid II:glycine glycyltransferase (peptidoglycan interpeptide bridge formation enzyme)